MTTLETSQQPVAFHQHEWPSTTQNMQQSLAGEDHCASPVAQEHQAVASPVPKEDPRLENKSAIWGFGIAEIVIGVLTVLLTIISLCIYEVKAMYNHYFCELAYSLHGIWGGILVIVTGMLAVRIKANHSRCMYIANMIMAIITSCVTFLATVKSAFVAVFSIFASFALMTINAVITLLLIASSIIAIIHAAFCCREVCFKNNSRLMQPVMYNPTQSNVMYPPQPQYDQGPNGQVMLAYVQQVPVEGHAHSGSLVQVVNRQQQVIHPPPQVMQPPLYNKSNAKKEL